MPTDKMHAEEVHTDVALVNALLAGQFPQWADLPIQPVPSAGTDNALYRIGDERVARLPRIPSAVSQIEKESTWLPRLAPHLPLSIPAPVAVGEPDAGYPFSWAIHRWIDGQNATLERLADPHSAALDLARFVTALQHIDTGDGVPPNAANGWRGQPLSERDEYNRRALPEVRHLIDANAALHVWRTALAAQPYRGEPVWIHGDLHEGNLLARNGSLAAVIDFGCLGTGDPAVDVMAAWMYLPASERNDFRTALNADDDTWARACGWALSFGLLALPYYVHTNPTLAAIAKRTIDQCVADQ